MASKALEYVLYFSFFRPWKWEMIQFDRYFWNRHPWGFLVSHFSFKNFFFEFVFTVLFGFSDAYQLRLWTADNPMTFLFSLYSTLHCSHLPTMKRTFLRYLVATVKIQWTCRDFIFFDPCPSSDLRYWWVWIQSLRTLWPLGSSCDGGQQHFFDDKSFGRNEHQQKC